MSDARDDAIFDVSKLKRIVQEARQKKIRHLLKSYSAVVDFVSWRSPWTCEEHLAMVEWCFEHTPGWSVEEAEKTIWGFASEEHAFHFTLRWR